MKCALYVVLASSVAAAGDLKGKVSGDGPFEAVVWLAGAVKEKLPPPKPAHVSQKGARFSPRVMAVQKGTTVDFTNDDWVTHSVYSVSATKKFDFGLYEKYAKRAVTFDQPGEIELLCSVHARMRAVLVVVPSPYFATVGDDGSFTIEGVPAGKYEAVLHKTGGATELRKPVDVTEAGDATVIF
jgi:plastocyanin